MVYAGHEIYKEKHFGVYRLNGRAVLSIEVRPLTPSLYPKKVLVKRKLILDRREICLWKL